MNSIVILSCPSSISNSAPCSDTVTTLLDLWMTKCTCDKPKKCALCWPAFRTSRHVHAFCTRVALCRLNTSWPRPDTRGHLKTMAFTLPQSHPLVARGLVPARCAPTSTWRTLACQQVQMCCCSLSSSCHSIEVSDGATREGAVYRRLGSHECAGAGTGPGCRRGRRQLRKHLQLRQASHWPRAQGGLLEAVADPAQLKLLVEADDGDARLWHCKSFRCSGVPRWYEK